MKRKGHIIRHLCFVYKTQVRSDHAVIANRNLVMEIKQMISHISVKVP